MVKAGIITQARMGSTRLPGKVLKEVNGKKLLQYHIERLQSSGLPIVIATTVNKSDDPIVEFAENFEIDCFRGDESDVLSRYYLAAKTFNLDVIVRVTSDCPLIDGELISNAVKTYTAQSDSWLYMSNCLERTYPRGFDFEVFTFQMLKDAHEFSATNSEREHVTPYFYQNKHGKSHFFSIKKNKNFSDLRLTVDEPDDLKLIENLIINYQADKMNESEICQLLRSRPDLAAINQHVEQKKI